MITFILLFFFFMLAVILAGVAYSANQRKRAGMAEVSPQPPSHHPHSRPSN